MKERKIDKYIKGKGEKCLKGIKKKNIWQEEKKYMETKNIYERRKKVDKRRTKKELEMK